MSEKTYDLAVVGSGFSGALFAMIARRLGRSVALLERSRHPRFAIGESSTPLANWLLEDLASRYDLPRIKPFSKWGTWQHQFPQIGCGLKRGFTFYHHALEQPWSPQPNRDNELLVAASPHDRVADTHWYRPELDHQWTLEAQMAGVDYFDLATIEEAQLERTPLILTGIRQGSPFQFQANFLIDASGHRGFLSNLLNLPERPFTRLPRTEALYTHFQGVRRWADLHPQIELPPYPVDDAAVHHLFDGGWVWVLRFNNDLVSAGVSATRQRSAEFGLQDGQAGWQRLLEHLPSLRQQFAGAQPTHPFVYLPQLSYRTSRVVGQHWALLPSAAGFVDPLLSTGFPLTLLGIRRLAHTFEKAWGKAEFASLLRAYEDQTFADLDTTERLLAALYANLDDFPLFANLSLLYFAAVSFTETALRLGRLERAGEAFLLGDDSGFAPGFKAICERARNPLSEADRDNLIGDIHRLIEPINVAGLTNASRRHWFPVDANDLIQAAPKLEADPAAIQALLRRCGF